MIPYLVMLTALTVLCSNTAVCSSGDRDHYFQSCVKKCIEFSSRNILPLYLQLLLWDVTSDCKYYCMFNVTMERVADQQEVLQYYGKWPFTRIFGIQEPASVLFCVLHCIAQYYGWCTYKLILSYKHKFYNLTQCQFLLNIFAWICAALFHTRDFYWTEKMDYFSATFVVALFLFTFFTRVFRKIHDKRVYAAGCIIGLIIGYHFYYMAFVRFDYGYNTKFMVTLGILNISCWLIWCYINHKSRPYVWKCALHMIAIFFLAALELWDFAPIFWILDGHALWHMATIPLSYFWYIFLVDEYLFELRYNLP